MTTEGHTPYLQRRLVQIAHLSLDPPLPQVQAHQHHGLTDLRDTFFTLMKVSGYGL